MIIDLIIPTIAKYLLIPLIGGLIGAAMRGWIENRRFFKLRKGRQISGKWRGQVSYLKPRWDKEDIEVEFYASYFSKWLNPRLVKGVIRSKEGPQEDLLFRGGFYQSEHLMIDYRSARPERSQFGSAILVLDSEARKLDGNFIGYFNQALTGNLTFERIN
jgi:hypothetical protein